MNFWLQFEHDEASPQRISTFRGRRYPCGSLVAGARRGADARAGGGGRVLAAARRALLHAGALVHGAPPAHDTRGAAPGRRRRRRRRHQRVVEPHLWHGVPGGFDVRAEWFGRSGRGRRVGAARARAAPAAAHRLQPLDGAPSAAGVHRARQARPLVVVACLVAKRVSTDDEARLSLLLQKLSREWSLLTSVTWDSAGGAFADAVYGGYVIITFGLLLARIFQEVPKGRRILEGFFLGIGLLLFLVLGGLELASLDSVPKNLTVNAAVLGSLSLVVAALFLLDLMGPRVYTATHHSQTDTQVLSLKSEKEKTVAPQPTNVHLLTGKQNGHFPLERPKDLDLEKNKEKKNTNKETKTDELQSNDELDRGYTKFADALEKDGLERSRFGSLRNGIEKGNYVRLSDPLFEPVDKLHYEQELAKFNEKYIREYLDSYDGGARLSVKENYLPELQTPIFSKVKTGRLKSLYDDVSPTYEQKRQSKSPTRARTVATPTLQQLEDYLRSSSRSRRGDTPALFPMEPIEERDKESQAEGRASATPTDPGYVQYAAGKWPDKREIRTPRHSPTQ